MASGTAHPVKVGPINKFSSTLFEPGNTWDSPADAFQVDPSETREQERTALIESMREADTTLRSALDMLERRQASEAKMLLAHAVYSHDKLGNALRRYRKRPTEITSTTNGQLPVQDVS